MIQPYQFVKNEDSCCKTTVWYCACTLMNMYIYMKKLTRTEWFPTANTQQC